MVRLVILRLLMMCLLPLLVVACSKKNEESGRIYFVARSVPGANLHSIDLQKNLVRHTNDSGSRDFDFTLDRNGNLFFTSNRILPEDRAARAKIGKFGSRRQDLNVLLLPAGTQEQKLVNAATPLGKTGMPESLANITTDGDMFSFVRTILPGGHQQKSREVIQDAAVDELYIQQGVDGTPKQIAKADVIIKPEWSPDDSKLAYATYDYASDTARLYVYHRRSGEAELLLENPWGINQIDSPQWSPDGKTMSLILHPLEKNKLRAVYLLDLQSKSITRLSAEGHSVQSPVSWSSEGKQLVYDANMYEVKDGVIEKPELGAEYTSHLFLVDLNSGAIKQLTTEDKAIHSTPEFSPDGRYIAYLYAQDRRSRKASLKVMDVQGKAIDTLHDSVNPGSPLLWR